MTQAGKDLGPKAIKAAIAVVLLVVLVMVVVSYWGTYRSSKASANGSSETTASAEATASGEATQSPEGGEGESSEAPPADSGTVIVLIDGLNFRTEPAKSGNLITGLDEGMKLVYIETTDGWYKVRTPEGKVGYVSASEQYTELQE